MLKNLKSEIIDKNTIVNEYISEYVKLLPLLNDKKHDNILKQEGDIYINKSNEYVEK